MDIQNKNRNKTIDLRSPLKTSIKNFLPATADSFLSERNPDSKENLANILFSWRAKEYEYHEKDKSWYWKMGAIFLTGVILGIFTKNVLTVITFLLFASVFYLYSKRAPEEIEIVLLEKGLKVSEVLYEYRELKSFWIFYDGTDHSHISFLRKNKLLPSLEIPIGREFPEEARKILKNFLPEKKQAESLASILEKKLKF
jgi:hypothetical protein